jgi:hypothetical protein
MWKEGHMGSFFSGNFRPHMMTVEECLCLDLLPLVWLGAVQPGTRRTGTICWPAGARLEYAATLEYIADLTTSTPWLRLMYDAPTLEDATPAEQIAQVQYQVRLVTTAQHYGGCKWWFACPLGVNETTACAKRVRQLYLPPGGKYFGCRHCHALTYESRRNRWATATRETPAVTVECTDVAEKRVEHALRRFVEGQRQE